VRRAVDEHDGHVDDKVPASRGSMSRWPTMPMLRIRSISYLRDMVIPCGRTGGDAPGLAGPRRARIAFSERTHRDGA
jgi:hypothetical protein